MDKIFENPLVIIIPNLVCVVIGIVVFIYRARSKEYCVDDLYETATTTLILAFLGWIVLEIAILAVVIIGPIFLFTKFCKHIKK
jgi:ABC-type multidrug transport system permease subunit